MTEPVTGPGPGRLADQRQLAGRDEAEAARLLGLLSPSQPDPMMEARVYARLTAQPGRGTAWRRAWVIAGVGVLLGTTTLAATLVHRWLAAPHPAPKAVPASMTASPDPRPVADPPSSPAVQAPEPAHAGDAPPVPIGPSGGDRAAAQRPMRAGPTKPRSSGRLPVLPTSGEPAGSAARVPATDSPGEARLAAARPEEAAMVLAAMRALRREHDPEKAGRLLDQYLARFSGGVLVEEALALGIEAALDRKDAAGARSLGEQYRRRYPGGRFTGVARQAMGSRAP